MTACRRKSTGLLNAALVMNISLALFPRFCIRTGCLQLSGQHEDDMLYQFFEGLVDPLKDEKPERPPASMWAFIWHYTKPFKWLFASTVVTSVLIAFIEVFAFERIGHLVDLASQADASTFLATHQGELIFALLVIGVAWPILTLIDELPFLQGIMGNMPMSIRWRTHR